MSVEQARQEPDHRNNVRPEVTVSLQKAMKRLLSGESPGAFYFQGRGGLGKTYLLVNFSQLAAIAGTRVRSCRLIDMVDPETRKPLYLEEQLIKGLTDPGEGETPLDRELVARCFKPYLHSRTEYERFLQHSPNLKVREAADLTRQDAFIACWNEISAQHPLVLRFDTLELLLGQSHLPETTLIRRPEAQVGVERLISWLIFALRGMKHTLAIFCGRPPLGYGLDEAPNYEALDRADQFPNRLEDNDLANTLHAAGLLSAESFITLRPLTDQAALTSYLKVYGLTQAHTKEQLSYIGRITEGIPLLLTLYAECELTATNPPSLFRVDPARIDTRLRFEEHLIDTILNPLQSRIHDTPEEHNRLILTYCYYILCYARRGLVPSHLRWVLRRIDPSLELTDELLKRLQAMALVKTIPSPFADASEPLLYLHDEIWLLIDESGAPDQLGLRKPVLDELCLISAEQVRKISQTKAYKQYLRVVADHVYYAITREFADGYRHYLTYMDHLLGQRNYEDALVLADVFWRMLTLTAVRPGGPTRIYRDELSETANLDFATVNAFDQVHYSKLLRAQGLNAEAVEVAAGLLNDLALTETLPDPATVEPADLSTWPQQLHLFVDLLLAHAYALTLAGAPADYATTARRQYELLIALLDNEKRVNEHLRTSRQEAEQTGLPLTRDDNLLRLRRSYLLGSTQLMLSQLHWQQLEYNQSIERAQDAQNALSAYREVPLALPGRAEPGIPEQVLSDYVLDEIASVRNNMAYAQAEMGNLLIALRLSTDLVENYAHRVQPYLQALILNTRAEILLRSNRYAEVPALIDAADQAAQASNVGRALGLVALTRARLARRVMNRAKTPQPEIEDTYQRAIALLRGERDFLRDAYHEVARALRDIAVWYRERNEPELQQEYQQRALKQINEALKLLPPEPTAQAVQRADLVETKVSIQINMGHYPEARAELEQLEAAVMGHPMPPYGQVVCATIALQWGLLKLLDESQRDLPMALHWFTVALARGFVFGSTHREQQAFIELVPDWMHRYVPPETQAAFRRDLVSGTVCVKLSDLPYQTGAPLTSKRWDEAWEQAVAFMIEQLGTNTSQ